LETLGNYTPIFAACALVYVVAVGLIHLITPRYQIVDRFSWANPRAVAGHLRLSGNSAALAAKVAQSLKWTAMRARRRWRQYLRVELSKRRQTTDSPPSTLRIEPFTNDAAGDNSHATASEISR